MIDRAPRRRLPKAVLHLVLVVAAYFAVAGVAWQVRNPRGNASTFWTHLPSALSFQRLPRYQDQP